MLVCADAPPPSRRHVPVVPSFKGGLRAASSLARPSAITCQKFLRGGVSRGDRRGNAEGRSGESVLSETPC
jgi:hypothetical protein